MSTTWQTWDARLRSPGPSHVRYDRPDGSKAVTWRTPTGEPGLGDHRMDDLVYVTPLTFELRQIPAAARMLVVTEGEKAADAVASAGIRAVGTVCGASGTPGPAVVALLASVPVVLAPDADAVGRAHMGRLGQLLEAAGVPRLAIVRPPAGVPSGWDLADTDAAAVRELIGDAWLRWIGPVAA